MIQLQGSPLTPGNSNSSSTSDPSAPWIISEELDSGTNKSFHASGKEFLGVVTNFHSSNYIVFLFPHNVFPSLLKLWIY